MSSKAAAIGEATSRSIEDLTLDVNQEIRVRATLDVTFGALLEQLGPEFSTPDGTPMPMKIEPRPGGRWYRDLGDENGHFWGHVQAIKRPTLLEITGPMFMLLSGGVEHPVSAERSGWRNADCSSPRGVWTRSERPQRGE